MPPRKRAQSAPKSVEPDEATAALADGEPDPDTPEADVTPPAPERSDLQTVDAPCPQCFPAGWPEGAFAVGCEHGSWKRD
ncbi:hypothetical protein AB0D11_02610 [Streptomyces monashensis]|uniref:hypothetical protein n=1 Tax=Streptomyces monashensis TaxID=1678012 RepID=UPI003402A135